MKIKNWECPHCKMDSGAMIEDHDCFDWQMHSPNTMKQLWRCDNCNGYYFVYFELSSITPLWETERKEAK